MQKEIALDALPLPGEPLQPKIDDSNKEIVELDIQERIRLQSARLSSWQLSKLNKRYTVLYRKLNHAGYNQLIVKRNAIYRQYQQSLYRLEQKPTKKEYQRYNQLKAMGKTITEKIDHLQPIVDEFDSIHNKIAAHHELIRFEIEDKQNLQAFQKEARVWEQQLKAAFKQSPRLHHKGIDDKGKPFINIPQIERIIVKDDRVMYLIKTTGQSLFEKLLGRWHSALPYGVDIASLVSDETLENLSSACNRVVTVERSQRGTNLFYVISRLDSPDGIPKKVLYQKVIDWYPSLDHHKTAWCAGVTNDRIVKWFNFEDHPHILIAGATQGGKSNHVNQMIATLTTMNTPDEVRVLLVDLKGGIEFTHWKGLQHQLKPMLTTPQQVLHGMQWLRGIMERRLEVFEEMKAKNLSSYNEKTVKALPRLICFVDEMATLIGLGDLTKDLHNELRVLSSQGRAVGIHLVLCTQHSSVDVLPGWVKTNMVLRISAKMPNHQASQVILDSVTAATLPDVAGRMVFSVGRSEIIAQSPYISDEQIEQSIKIANKFKPGDDTEFTDVLPAPQSKKPEFTREMILDFALNMNGKLSPTRIHDIVGNDVIPLRELRAKVDAIKDELEGKGCIEYKGIKYKMGREKKAYVIVPIEDDNEQDNELSTSGDMVAS